MYGNKRKDKNKNETQWQQWKFVARNIIKLTVWTNKWECKNNRKERAFFKYTANLVGTSAECFSIHTRFVDSYE